MIQQRWLYKGDIEGRPIAGIPTILSHALQRRGISDELQAWAFLHPEEQQLSNPYLLSDMDKAVERIRRAVKNGEQVCVYGDFDADGICATAIMSDCLRGMGVKVQSYIPSRHDEGYGVNIPSIEYLHEQGVSLIVTVDNGISAVEEVLQCSQRGIDVVILDHHKCHEVLPDCSAVVCSSRDDYSTLYNDFCGAGVAYKTACALDDEAANRYLPLVALATVADVVRLTNENRMLVKKGMEHIADNLGLRCLLKVAGVQNSITNETTLAFTLAPRMNAAGRMGDAMRAVELLLCDDEEKAMAQAELLDNENRLRREQEQRIFDECMEQLSNEEQQPALILCGKDWNSGVIGIVASRLCDRYAKPVILFTHASDGTLRGSGRSVEGADLFDLINGCKQHTVRFGGHSKAAGLTLLAEQYAPFRAAIIKALEGKTFMQSFTYEEAITLADCTVESVEWLKLLAPFGEGNEEPAYLLEGCKLKRVATMGKDGKHLSAIVEQDGKTARLVAFGQGHNREEYERLSSVDLLVQLKLNDFNGTRSCNLHLVALREKKKKQNW